MKREATANVQLEGKKILFANFPADGHFNPMTGLAIHLKYLGADVRWYSSGTYTEKLKKLGIHHYPFKKAVDVAGNDFDTAFPERAKKKTMLGKLKFDIIHAFVLRGPEYYKDISDIQEEFPFDMVIADCAFAGIPLIKELIKKPVVAIGVMPLTETSKDAPPAGLGMMPAKTFFGKIKQELIRTISDGLIFKQPNKVMYKTLAEYNVPHNGESLFDMITKKSDVLLQSGTPGFEYYRSDLGKNIHFIGALLPYNSSVNKAQWFDNRLNEFQQVVLVTQGTVEKDVEKLLVPTLEAFKNSNTLVVCTTGGSKTKELKERYPQYNIIIEDFIPFGDVMPYADVYITNGGYGGVMLGIENKLPLVVAGVHEGKNDINARVGYFKLGINLKKERPASQQILHAVKEVLNNPEYKQNAEKLAGEFRQYDPNKLSTEHIVRLLSSKTRMAIKETADIY